jgi:hypothetical protein
MSMARPRMPIPCHPPMRTTLGSSGPSPRRARSRSAVIVQPATWSSTIPPTTATCARGASRSPVSQRESVSGATSSRLARSEARKPIALRMNLIASPDRAPDLASSAATATSKSASSSSATSASSHVEHLFVFTSAVNVRPSTMSFSMRVPRRKRAPSYWRRGRPRACSRGTPACSSRRSRGTAHAHRRRLAGDGPRAPEPPEVAREPPFDSAVRIGRKGVRPRNRISRARP